jgi:hypothetical protein
VKCSLSMKPNVSRIPDRNGSETANQKKSQKNPGGNLSE